MSQGSFGVRNSNASEAKFSSFHQLVHIKSKTDSHLLNFSGQNKNKKSIRQQLMHRLKNLPQIPQIFADKKLNLRLSAQSAGNKNYSVFSSPPLSLLPLRESKSISKVNRSVFSNGCFCCV